ncbi:hypothetical protein GUITHDRAFT_108840 [Guillardia theta CCMP2712]|uniref:WW domain-containing protein n=1 Tax=Guillardia theta (strain CCMP2712) TaxID=905079 RepID=L1J9G8_GUITC|nr:hypothetical protein GUITHDRAFT_108840 [Guillardia theta CCMP2712]EKX45198.1 hypothetical protein GUITHDRAFT_108840 [Guillardia theta CCMP2712]|eukprot:XP_005832178.1 hypothetical protein GUITHDRAFT_108840 [Guillardia theta CCMP2712]
MQELSLNFSTVVYFLDPCFVQVFRAPQMPRKSKRYPPEVLDFAVYLGIDVDKEEDLIWIAGEQCLSEELPEPWTEHTSSRGDIYFYNSETDESTVEHPLFHKYRMLYEEKRQEKECDLLQIVREAVLVPFLGCFER